MKARIFLLVFGLCGSALAADPGPAEMAVQIGIDQKLGARLPGDIRLEDEDGRPVRLADYLGKKPVILNFVYLECAVLCPLLQDGLVKALRVLRLAPPRDFEILSVSINPRDMAEAARSRKARVLGLYGRPAAAAGWHFLRGRPEAVRALTRAAGFRYAEGRGQFAHAAGIVILTPEGRIARYFYGVEFSPRDLRFALAEAGCGRTGSLADRLLLLCYHYDPFTGKYGFAVAGALRGLGILTLAALAGFIAASLRRERARKA